MSRVHDALRKAVDETDKSPGIRAVESKEEDPLSERFDSIPVSRNGAWHPADLSALAQEQVNQLVQRVFMVPNSCASRRVVFASVDKGCGSSELCFLAGAALSSRVSGSVCMVDANLHAPLLHQLFKADMFPGFADAMVSLKSIKDFALRIADGNIWLVPPGSPELQSSGLSAPDRLCSRMTELKDKFDYVLIDAPPMGSCADAVLLAREADGIILVVEAHSTRRETARRAKEALQAAKVNLLGAILNNRTFPIPDALYHRL